MLNVATTVIIMALVEEQERCEPMIFQETWEWVIGVSPYTGEPKTETRRLWVSNETIYHIGQVYAVQPGRGKTSVGRIRILDKWRDMDVRDIDATALRREGFDCPERFLWTWCKLRDKRLYKDFEGYAFQFGIKDPAESFLANEAFWLAVIARPLKLYDAVVYQFEKAEDDDQSRPPQS